MTDEQEEMIKRLRLQGLSYGKIAKQMDMKMETVSSHCRRRGIGRKDTPVKTAEGICYCKNCGVKVAQNPGRKKKIFCSDECRLNWWNAHPDQIRHRSTRDIVCANCGKTFSVYGSKERKYCCRECYLHDRFG